MSDSSENDGRHDSRPHGNRSGAPRSGGRPTGGRPGEGRPSDGRPRRDNAAGGPARGKPASGSDRPWRNKPEGDDRRPRRDGDSAGADRRPRRDADGSDRAPRRDSSAGDDRRPRRDAAGDRDGRPQRSGDRDSRPPRSGDRDSRPPRSGDRPDRGDRPARPFRSDGSGRPERGGRPDRGSDRRGGPDEKRLWTKGGAPARGDRDASEREPEEDRDPFGIRSVRAYHQAPEIPEGVTPKMLDRVASNELKTLSKENAEGVALHLVMVSRLIEEDPELAHQHAISAARRAGRIGVVRETLAITAYATADYALALRELRTYRRITGRDDQLPMMVDSERGLERPERALELGRSVKRSTLSSAVQVELAIAMSGARLDLGHAEEALVELQIPQLDPDKAFSYSPALFGAYGTVLEELGRDDEAAIWFSRADVAEAALGDDEDDMIEVVEEELEFDASDDGAVEIEDANGPLEVADEAAGNDDETGERVS
ncbi:primosomal protein [Salinibacterium sp. SWN167]|uniref:primosomal protein n=1 Tax=Salinibacterium sp. SWN167 TaxID=2792054 RepID=UPI001E35F3CA|nr:primosomal protein [Salinibacterium sp. SWN167]